MKTHHIIATLWLVLCSIFGVSILWGFRPSAPKYESTLQFYMAILFGVAYLFGVVASIFLFRGARWARIFIGIVALLSMLSCVMQYISYRSLPAWGIALGVFSLISVVLLFWPKHEPVA
jgi:uncharacterized membrane protein